MFWLYDLPIWQLGTLIVSTFVLFTSVGLVLSRRTIYRTFRVSDDTNETVNGIFAGAGVLLGLLLGLVAVAAWENYETVDDVVVKEAAAVAALYRDVSTLKDPDRVLLQQDLKDYLAYVVNVAWPAHRKGETPKGGALILSAFLGKLTVYHADTPEQRVFLAEVFAAYNKLIEAQRLRMGVVTSGLPVVFWVVILAGVILSVFITYFFHVSLLKMHLMLTGLFSAFLGFMIFLILAVDNPLRGEVSISPDPYADVLNNLKDLEATQTRR